METQNQENKSSTDKTIILSIVPGGKDMILLYAKANNVGYDSLGQDQNEKDVIKFTYSKDQQKTIDSIGVYVKFIEALVAGLKPILEPVLQVLKDEADKLCKDMKIDNIEKRKFPRFKSELKNKADGNEAGKHAA